MGEETIVECQAIDGARETPTPSYINKEFASTVVNTEAGWRHHDEKPTGKK